MRFDELILRDTEGEPRVPFHPELTVLCGLGKLERRALVQSILGSLVGGRESTTLRFADAAGQAVTVASQEGRFTARYNDGSPAPAPLGSLGTDPVALRSLMLLSADDLGVMDRATRADEPPELREARAMLDELTAEVQAALGQQKATETLQGQLDLL